MPPGWVVNPKEEYMESTITKQSYETPTVVNLGSLVEETQGSPLFNAVEELDITGVRPYRPEMDL
jgi:hypothetical protein